MICDLCKLLYNPLKREMLLRIYSARDGMNVGVLADEMDQGGLCPSGVSQYLKELAAAGAIRRIRSGRYVNYHPIATDDVRRVVEAFVKSNGKIAKSTLDAVFGALMNPFRAGVVASLARSGSKSAIDICEKTGHRPRYLQRDLKAAVDAGLIWADDSEISCAVYHFIPPTDPFVKLLVSSC